MMIVTHEIRVRRRGRRPRDLHGPTARSSRKARRSCILKRPSHERTRSFLQKILTARRGRLGPCASPPWQPCPSTWPTGMRRSARVCAAAASPRHRQAGRRIMASSAGARHACGADAASIEAALAAMRPFVIGRDPWHSEAIARDVYRTGSGTIGSQTGNFAYAGIDMALWDLCGKDVRTAAATDCSVARSRTRSTISTISPGARRTRCAAQCARRRGARLSSSLPQGRRRRRGRGGDARGGPRRRRAGRRGSGSTPTRPGRSPEAVRLLTAGTTASASTSSRRRFRTFPLHRCAICGDNAGCPLRQRGARQPSRGLSGDRRGVGGCGLLQQLLGRHAAPLPLPRLARQPPGRRRVQAYPRRVGHRRRRRAPSAADAAQCDPGAQQTAAIMADDLLTSPLPIATSPAGEFPMRPGSASRSTR